MAGRFLTADPYEASGGAGAPGSWNRYPYVGGDPVNWNDSKGLKSDPPRDYLPGNPSPPPVPPPSAPTDPGVDWPDDSAPGGQDDSKKENAEAQRQKIINQTFYMFGELMKQKSCAGIFNTTAGRPNVNPILAIYGMSVTRAYGYLQFGPLPVDKYGVGPGGLTQVSSFKANEYGVRIPQSVTITIQTIGRESIFEIGPGNAALALIHELGHAYNLLPELGGSLIVADKIITDANGKVVEGHPDGQSENFRTINQRCNFTDIAIPSELQ